MKKGSALLMIILVIALLASLSALGAKIVYNSYSSANSVLIRAQALYLAEAGIEQGKVNLAHNPNWYTDLPAAAEDDCNWLVHNAVGQRVNFGEGSFKLVRERGKDRFYAIGLKGKGVVVLKLVFPSPPFQSAAWSEI